MLHWYRNLYMDEAVQKKTEKSKRRVEMCHKSFRQSLCFWKQDYYVIMLAENPQNLFEIIEIRQLFFRRYQHMDLYVVALAVTKERAVRLLKDMLTEIWESDRQFCVRGYFDKEDFS